MVGENVLKLTEIAYIPLHTSIYLLIPMKLQNKNCTTVNSLRAVSLNIGLPATTLVSEHRMASEIA